MLIEEEQQAYIPKLLLPSRTKQKQVMNSHVVMLIKDKLIPLNKARYQHLQKINRTINKEQYKYITASTESLTLHHVEERQSIKKKGFTTREGSSDLATDILLARLKSMKNLDNSHRLLEQSRPGYKCWDSLQKDISDSALSTAQRIDSSESKCRTGNRKQPLFDLVMRAEKHLRLKKHQLKQNQRDKEEGRRTAGKPTQLQAFINRLAGHRVKVLPEEQLQRQLLRDIRLTMLEQKMNKLKRDINHKKIVQMR